jgi:hypothetical protein
MHKLFSLLHTPFQLFICTNDIANSINRGRHDTSVIKSIILNALLCADEAIIRNRRNEIQSLINESSLISQDDNSKTNKTKIWVMETENV